MILIIKGMMLDTEHLDGMDLDIERGTISLRYHSEHSGVPCKLTVEFPDGTVAKDIHDAINDAMRKNWSIMQIEEESVVMDNQELLDYLKHDVGRTLKDIIASLDKISTSGKRGKHS